LLTVRLGRHSGDDESNPLEPNRFTPGANTFSASASDYAGNVGSASISFTLTVVCPGALTAELVERLGPEAVGAIDPSARFVAAASARQPGVRVQRATAEDLPFPDGMFDAALAQLVVHFMRDPLAGLREMARVTRTGGVAAACVWDHAGDGGPLALFWSAVRELDPAADDESHLPGTVKVTLANSSEQPD
jgi:SAM-dependent methyltransferase